MKKLLSISAVCLSIPSWVFFLFLTFLAFAPWNLIKSIDQYVLTNYSIEFSELQSYGNALNRNLIFNNLYIIHNDRVLIQAAEFELGLSFKPLNLFNFLNINRILIKDGFFDNSNMRISNSSLSSLTNLSERVS